MSQTRGPVIATVVLATLVAGGLAWTFIAGRQHAAVGKSTTASDTTAGALTTVDSPKGTEVAVALSDAAKARAGITTRALGAAGHAGELHLAGELIADPSLVTTVQAPVAGRLNTIPDGHWPGLGEHVDSGATLGQISDARPLTASRAGIVQQVEAQPGQLVQPGQALLTLTDFATPLVRIVWTADAPLPPPTTLTIAPLMTGASPAARSAPARLMGAPPSVDSLTRFPVYLYRASHTWPGSGPGTPIVATIASTGSVMRGVFVPTEAGVQWEGLVWVYVERTAAHYVRVSLDTSRPVEGGWLVMNGPVALGDQVVVQGAQQLLSQEFRSRATVGDEDDNGSNP